MSKEYEDFLEMAFTPSKSPPRLGVFCEECDDLTIIESGGAVCGHRPKKLDEIVAWAAKQEQK